MLHVLTSFRAIAEAPGHHAVHVIGEFGSNRHSSSVSYNHHPCIPCVLLSSYSLANNVCCVVGSNILGACLCYPLLAKVREESCSPLLCIWF